MVKIQKSFSPVHPFDIVVDEIEARGLTKKEFAESIGMKPSNLSRMINKRGALTSEMALKLEDALGIPFSHWMKFQEEYLKDCARLRKASQFFKNPDMGISKLRPSWKTFP